MDKLVFKDEFKWYLKVKEIFPRAERVMIVSHFISNEMKAAWYVEGDKLILVTQGYRRTPSSLHNTVTIWSCPIDSPESSELWEGIPELGRVYVRRDNTGLDYFSALVPVNTGTRGADDSWDDRNPPPRLDAAEFEIVGGHYYLK